MMNKISKLGLAALLAGALTWTAEAVDLSQYTPLEKQLIKHEGFKNQRYYDTGGLPHVGVGFNLTRPDAKTKLAAVGADYSKVINGKQSLNDQQVTILFRQDLSNAVYNASTIIRNYGAQPANVQNVVTDMVFNMGPAKFKEFKKTITSIESGDYQTAASRMKKSAWYSQVGNRGRYLTNLMENTQRSEQAITKR